MVKCIWKLPSGCCNGKGELVHAISGMRNGRRRRRRRADRLEVRIRQNVVVASCAGDADEHLFGHGGCSSLLRSTTGGFGQFDDESTKTCSERKLRLSLDDFTVCASSQLLLFVEI